MMAAQHSTDGPWVSYFPYDLGFTDRLYAVFSQYSDALIAAFPGTVLTKMLQAAQLAGGLSPESEDRDMDVSNLLAYFVSGYEDSTPAQKILLRPVVKALRQVIAEEKKTNASLLDVDTHALDIGDIRLLTLINTRQDVRDLLIAGKELS